jgi:coenzyme Q-binding protein COQ10
MPHFTTERHVAHSADEMFDLVADVERYPEFVPLCERLIVKARRAGQGTETLVADMTVGFKAFRETFTTRVVLDRPRFTIDAQYLEGPFHHLDSRWTFVPDGAHACRITFAIDYAFKSRLLGAVIGGVFDTTFRRLAEAFEARADAVYPKAAAQPA